MEKLNIAELLKDCPKGMELDCAIFEGLEFDCIVDNEYLPIRCRIKHPNGGYNVYNFTKYGCWLDTTFAKCVIFPKGKTTWEGFQRPFKDGDVLIGGAGKPFIFKSLNHRRGCYSYCGIDSARQFKLESDDWTFANSLRFATEEEKQKLFDAIKANGYKWNAETKTLEKMPKFKVGNKIKLKGGDQSGIITQVSDCFYTINCKNHTHYWAIAKQDDWELVPNKFDISTLVPFESKVLVRDVDHYEWEGAIFGRYDGKKFFTIGGLDWGCCIPYEGNEHLHGTTNECSEYYKNW